MHLYVINNDRAKAGESMISSVVADAMPPPSEKRLSMKLLVDGLGLSRPSGEGAVQDKWSYDPPSGTREALAAPQGCRP